MSNKVDKSNLGYLDMDFQYKLVKMFMEDNRFFESLVTVVDQNAFTDSLLRTYVGTLKDYYTKQGVVPSYETLKFVLNEKSRTSTEIEEWDEITRKLKNDVSYDGYSVVKDTAVKFFKQQNLIKVANKILEIAGSGEIERYDDCQRMLDKALEIGQEDDLGFSIFDLQEKALSPDYTVSIPTGIIQMDEVLGGGLDKGKMGLIIAPAGFGKTSFTTAIAAYAASYKCDMNNNEGFKVLQIYFEDVDIDMARKHFSKITQYEARRMKRLDEAERDEVNGLLNNYADREALDKNLRLKRFKSGTKSASDIEIYLKRQINSGFKPDLLIIDYFECLASERGGFSNDSEWSREGVTMRRLENLALDYDIAIWIPTQGRKDSMNSPEGIRMDQSGGSVKKVQVAQIVISIARSTTDMDKNRAVISILKNRSGKSGKIFNNVLFDNGTCTIKCDEIQEFDDSLTFNEEMARSDENARIDMIRNLQQQRKNYSNRTDLLNNERNAFKR